MTPGYGPPEQVLGHRVGPAADIFALGAVLTYAATAKRAFDAGHVAAVQYEVVHGEPQFNDRNLRCGPSVAPCLAKSPEWRPTPDQLLKACAPPARAERAWKRGALAEDIADREREAARLTAMPTQAGGSGTTVIPGGPSRRRLLAGIAIGGSVVAAGGGTAAWWWRRGDDAGGAPSWEAKPLSDHETGTAPKVLWGPTAAASGHATAPVPVRDLVVVARRGAASRSRRSGR